MTGFEGEHPDDGLRCLVVSAMSRDPEAIKLLWDRQRRWVAALLLAYKPREADLEDLLQEVAMAFVRKIGELREPEAFKPWLRSVAINAARLAGRKQTTARRHTSQLRLVVEREQEQPSTPDVVSAKREEGRRLLDLAMQMPESYREPLLLRCLHGMSYREIGQILGLPDTTIETRIARGRRMLRERAAGQESATRTERTLPGGPAGEKATPPGQRPERSDEEGTVS